ncbi:Hsp20 family protein [Pleionea litopenaei]|uniref:Hsp20 family protein n=1 Tax=Pleionea litopenaei TaxID=3070815 RepID=A0AA51RV97_9GAMM|nr:Hsp20 family protein [Pleionea sp. HL-JVS1]WMS88247.1 Hsp20 family protein [Pleionea sp. HL-JVS1]
MTTRFNLTPLFRQSVGFDRFNDLFENVFQREDTSGNGYPPYNIEKSGDNEYIITMAVAGFTEDDLEISVKKDTLTVAGKIAEKEAEEGVQFLYRGIATRAFERHFRLADHVEVSSAGLEHGLLKIKLTRQTPQEELVKKISINNS